MTLLLSVALDDLWPPNTQLFIITRPTIYRLRDGAREPAQPTALRRVLSNIVSHATGRATNGLTIVGIVLQFHTVLRLARQAVAPNARSGDSGPNANQTAVARYTDT